MTKFDVSKQARRFRGTCALGVGVFFAALSAHAISVTVNVNVPGTSDPWLAGMPAGSTAPGGDTAPAQSPVFVSTLDITLGTILTFTNATGSVSNGPGCTTSCDPIDGAAFFNHSGGVRNGISDVRAPINSLVGIFLNANQPSLSPAPATLNFQTIGRNFLTLSPVVRQVFFIGDGMTSGGTTQQFNLPTGATRLFLGTMDGFGWFNNSGSINLNVTLVGAAAPPVGTVPEPSSLALMGIALAGLMAARKRSVG